MNSVKISDELAKSFERMQNDNIDPLNISLGKLKHKYEVTEDSVFDFARALKDGSIQLKDGQTMLQGYQAYLKSTSKSLTLADIGTKALSASMKVFSTIGWML